jgi:hypothetical protein
MGILSPRPNITDRYVGDVGRDLISVSDAPNNGHVSEAAKPTLMSRKRQ